MELNNDGKYFEVVDRWRVPGTRKYRISIKCQCGNIAEKGHSYINGASLTCGLDCPISKQLRIDRKKGRTNYTAMLPAGQSGFNRLFEAYRLRAIKYEREFNLTPDEFRELTSSDCHYCGATPSMEYIHAIKGRTEEAIENGKYIYNSVDRIDNNKGYITGNCRPSCKICNNMKVNHTEGDFAEYIKRIYTHFAKNYTEETNEG